MKEKKPIKKAPYDWRDGVCQFCGVDAPNGCCPQHSMECHTCRGWGATSKKLYEILYKQNQEKRSNPPNKCCEDCSAYFAHSMGSHSDTRDSEPCSCNMNSCNWIYCECHLTT